MKVRSCSAQLDLPGRSAPLDHLKDGKPYELGQRQLGVLSDIQWTLTAGWVNSQSLD